MQSMNFEKLAEKIGVTDVTITAGKNKDLLNPFRPVKDAHVESLQKLVDDSYTQFVNLVLAARPNVSVDLLDGRVYSATDALEFGMIDEIGYWEQAVNSAGSLIGEENIRIVKYEEPIGFATFFAQMQLPEVPTMLTNQRPQMLYMWRP